MGLKRRRTCIRCSMRTVGSGDIFCKPCVRGLEAGDVVYWPVAPGPWPFVIGSEAARTAASVNACVVMALGEVAQPRAEA